MSRYSKIRSKSANDAWTSVETCSIEPIGKKSRDWSVVKATMSPAFTLLKPFLLICQPATRYTSAGVIEKNVPTTAKKERPIIVWRIWRPVRRSFSSWYRPIS